MSEDLIVGLDNSPRTEIGQRPFMIPRLFPQELSLVVTLALR
jgi:hypothetical protein